MNTSKKKGRKHIPNRRLSRHKKSMIAIIGVLIFLSAVVFIHGMTLKERNETYMAQEAELQAQIEAEQERSEEIDELKEYVGTDEYIEQIAKEKLGLVHENEILFKSAQ